MPAEAAVLLESLDRAHDPLKLLDGVSQMLRAGGLVFVTALVCSGFDMVVLGAQNMYLYPPDRANCFSLDGLERLLVRAGYKPVELSTPGVLDVEIVAVHQKHNPNLKLSPFEAAVDGWRPGNANSIPVVPAAESDEFICAHCRQEGFVSEFLRAYFDEASTLARLIDVETVDRIVQRLARLRSESGRLFLCGIGGSAGNCSHAVNDFRKLCGIDASTPGGQCFGADGAH